VNAGRALAARHPAAIQRSSRLRSSVAELGFELRRPVTNSPEEFLDFYGQHNGNIVVADRPAFDKTGRRQHALTGWSGPSVGCVASLAVLPGDFQAYVPKRLELRDCRRRQVFAAESFSANTTRHDWRRYDLATLRYPHERLRNSPLRQLVNGRFYTARRHDSHAGCRYVFIEINPSGQYLWIEKETGLPITAAICDLLMAGQGCTT
jgi:hypothetical protein